MNLSNAIEKHTQRVQAVMALQNRRGKQPAKGKLPDLWAEAPVSLALLAPFIQEVLGYDIFDLNLVVPEYPADLKYMKAEKTKGTVKKVDYALMQEGEPSIPLLIVECKSRQKSFPPPHPDSSPWKGLHDYWKAVSLATTVSPTLLYTDGLRYIFYTDCEKEGTLDREPFLTLDWRSALTNEIVEDLTTFVDCLRSGPTPADLRRCACQIKERTYR